MKEIWRDIIGYKGLYQVSDLGRVRSTKKRAGKPRIRKSYFRGDYYIMTLSKKNKPITYYLHNLVWDAFGDKPRNGRKLQVDHRDENKLNNKISNLQLLTPRQNTIKYRRTIPRDLPIGVSKFSVKSGLRYFARAYYRGKDITIGYYNTPREASIAFENWCGDKGFLL